MTTKSINNTCAGEEGSLCAWILLRSRVCGDSEPTQRSLGGCRLVAASVFPETSLGLKVQIYEQNKGSVKVPGGLPPALSSAEWKPEGGVQEGLSHSTRLTHT